MTPNDIKAFMERHGLSISELAEILGVQRPAVDHWLKGRRQVGLTVARLLRLFDRNPALMREFAA